MGGEFDLEPLSFHQVTLYPPSRPSKFFHHTNPKTTTACRVHVVWRRRCVNNTVAFSWPICENASQIVCGFMAWIIIIIIIYSIMHTYYWPISFLRTRLRRHRSPATRVFIVKFAFLESNVNLCTHRQTQYARAHKHAHVGFIVIFYSFFSRTTADKFLLHGPAASSIRLIQGENVSVVSRGKFI